MKRFILAAAIAFAPVLAFSQDQATTIAADAPVLTMINVWTPHNGDQAGFVTLLEDALANELIAQPGFVSGNIHRSLDSVHVVMYAQWADQAALETFVAKLQSGRAPRMSAAFAAATPDYHPYAVTATGQGE